VTILLEAMLTFALAAAVTAALVPLVRRMCWQYGWLAQPNARSMHTSPIPTLGGVAILVGFLVALGASALFARFDPTFVRTSYESLRLLLLLIGVLLVAGISLADDLYNLPVLPRLGVHILAALVAVGPYLWDHTLYPDMSGAATEARGIILTAFNFPFVEQVHLHNLSPYLAIGATVFWIVGMQNMLNWLDGLDGLAAGVTCIAALVLALHALELGQWTVALLPLALAGACFGFLPSNIHPARIFMGDVGAMSLGYILAVSAIIGGAKLATALLVLGVPIIDMAWLIISRVRHGRSAAHAGRDHLHHRLIALGFSQRQVVALYYLLSTMFGAIALLDVMTPTAKLLALILLGLLVLATIWYAGREAEDRVSV
jgi:UDP-N-acetylmuramyl pentapeptide phosphotransferase/UDP-N-acetylglucosamine-1-phosphate transferase